MLPHFVLFVDALRNPVQKTNITLAWLNILMNKVFAYVVLVLIDKYAGCRAVWPY
jgi:hypothetical protein